MKKNSKNYESLNFADNKTDNSTNEEISITKAESNEVYIETETANNINMNMEINKDLSRTFINTFSVNKNTKTKKKKSTIFLYIFVIIVCVGVILYTAYRDFNSDTLMSFSEIMSLVGKNWYYLVLAIASFFGVLVFQGLKTSFILKATSNKFNFWLGFKTAIIGKFYDNVTPLGAGGQPFEVYYLQKKGVELGTATALTVTSFFFSQIIFVVITILCLIFCPENINIATKTMAYIGLVCYLFVPLLIILFSFIPNITTKIVTGLIKFLGKIKLIKHSEEVTSKAITAVKNNTACVKKIVKNKLTVILVAIFSIGLHCAICSIAYFTLKTFNYDIPANGFKEWLEILTMCMILYSAVTIIPTPGNAGASELTFYFVFTTTLSGGVGFTAMMAWRILSYYAFLIAGSILLISIKISAKKKLRKTTKFSD